MSLSTSPLFITATGTGQGKTYVTCLLARQMAQQRQPIRVIKPVISGFEEAQFEQSDTARIIAATGGKMQVAECSPWQFLAPLSPDAAAAKEGKAIDYDELIRFCQQSGAEVIEGAGGLMTPLTAQHTHLNWMADIGAQAVLVSGLYLGCISHTLCAIAALSQHGVALKGLVLSAAQADAMDAQTITASLSPHLPVGLPVFVLKHVPESGSYWQQQPDLTRLILR